MRRGERGGGGVRGSGGGGGRGERAVNKCKVLQYKQHFHI